MDRRRQRLIERSASSAVRLLAGHLLSDADRALTRIEDHDPEALHDFRVALRRLRTLLRAYRELDLVPHKWRCRLRDLAHTTNDARDLEVAAEQLRRWIDEGLVAAQPLHQRIVEQRERVHEATVTRIEKAWPKLAMHLRESLEQCGCHAPEVSFAQITSELMEAECKKLQSLIEALRSAWEDETAHGARLIGKRLRYLAEPLVEEITAAEIAITTLRAFQNRLGALHDNDLLLVLVAEAAALDAALVARARVFGDEHLSQGTDYQTLAQRLRQERQQMVELIRAEYVEKEVVLEEIAGVIQALRAPERRKVSSC